MSWWPPRKMALEIASSVRSGFGLSRLARLLPGLETKHAFGVGLETLTPSGAISN